MQATETRLPIPDPTTLTTEQLLRTTANLREVFETRLMGMDKAIGLLQAFADKSPTTAIVEQSVKELRLLTDEKFKSVETSLRERDTRTAQFTKENKVAVDAAFAASALSITKSEAAFTKQVDSLATAIASMSKTFDDKINDMKDRLTSIESQKATAARSEDRSTSLFGVVISAAVAVVIVTTALVGLIVFLVNKH